MSIEHSRKQLQEDWTQADFLITREKWQTDIVTKITQIFLDENNWGKILSEIEIWNMCQHPTLPGERIIFFTEKAGKKIQRVLQGINSKKDTPEEHLLFSHIKSWGGHIVGTLEQIRERRAIKPGLNMDNYELSSNQYFDTRKQTLLWVELNSTEFTLAYVLWADVSQKLNLEDFRKYSNMPDISDDILEKIIDDAIKSFNKKVIPLNKEMLPQTIQITCVEWRYSFLIGKINIPLGEIIEYIKKERWNLIDKKILKKRYSIPKSDFFYIIEMLRNDLEGTPESMHELGNFIVYGTQEQKEEQLKKISKNKEKK